MIVWILHTCSPRPAPNKNQIFENHPSKVATIFSSNHNDLLAQWPFELCFGFKFQLPETVLPQELLRAHRHGRCRNENGTSKGEEESAVALWSVQSQCACGHCHQWSGSLLQDRTWWFWGFKVWVRNINTKTRQKIQNQEIIMFLVLNQRPKSSNFIFRNPHYWNSSWTCLDFWGRTME